MWQAPNQRVRAAANAKKRQRERNRRPLHIKRVTAEVKLLGGPAGAPAIFKGRVLLNDLNSKGMGIFSVDPLTPGQEIAITMDHPKRIYLKGRVTWCQEYDVDSHILSAQPFSYRAGIEFVYDSPEEEKAVKEYCDAMAREHIFNPKAA